MKTLEQKLDQAWNQHDEAAAQKAQQELNLTHGKWREALCVFLKSMNISSE